MDTPNDSLHESGRTDPVGIRAQVIALSELEQSPVLQSPITMFPSGEEPEGGDSPIPNPIHQIKATLSICVGNAHLTVSDLLGMREKQVICLDRTIEQPVDIILEGHVIARGTLVAVDDYFGVQITELPLPLKP